MFQKLSVMAIAATLVASTASAGGYAAPVVEAPPVVAPVTVTEPAGPWQGAYAGAELGYAFSGDDNRISLIDPDGNELADSDLSGPNISLRAGYRLQRDRWVIGPEAFFTAGDISDDRPVDVPGLGTFDLETQVDRMYGVKLKAGYLVQPDLLAYGLAGWQKGFFSVSGRGEGEVKYNADGYVVGLGLEKMVSDRMSVTGEWEYNDFGENIERLGRGYTGNATPAFHNLKVGLNFKF